MKQQIAESFFFRGKTVNVFWARLFNLLIIVKQILKFFFFERQKLFRHKRPGSLNDKGSGPFIFTNILDFYFNLFKAYL